MAWNFPDGVDPEERSIMDSEESETSTDTDDIYVQMESLTETEEAGPASEYQQQVDEREEEESSQTAEEEPFAVLKVYGRQIPVSTKEELIALAQQGVDYDNKMYKLRDWKQLVNLYETNSKFKEISDKALRGESFLPVESNEQSTAQATEKSSTFKKYIKEQVSKELTPYQEKMEQLEKELFFKEMKLRDPEHFDVIFNVCKDLYHLPASHPSAIPPALKTQINEDKEVFKVYYNFVRDKVLALKNNTPQPELPEELKPGNDQSARQPAGNQLKRVVRKAPVLESGRDNGGESSSPMTEAEKIWSMPTSKFNELMKRAERGYNR